jgi:hypothetical protein
MGRFIGGKWHLSDAAKFIQSGQRTGLCNAQFGECLSGGGTPVRIADDPLGAVAKHCAVYTRAFLTGIRTVMEQIALESAHNSLLRGAWNVPVPLR